MLPDEEFADQILSICRTTAGDGLRTVIAFTPDDWEVLYMRSDLQQIDDRVREIKGRFVDNERLGFDARETYNKELTDPGVEPDIGEYEFTIRVFSEGFVSRVIVGEVGVLLTTDEVHMDSFEDLAVALRRLLADA